MTFNLNGMSKRELEKLAGQVQNALKAVEASEKKKALEAAQKAAAEFGYSLSEITQYSGRKTGKAMPKRPPKYFNPKNKSQTWSGAGRQPFWFKDALKAGTDPSKLEI